ncbi:hypothetical protein CCUS01_13299 [Colletotrichum cuscutae]|uniref:Uncharacterized protein n=1 Tax=Colletotrichum cuscutae TaxID=1209917 RepID=A0AAI9YCB3_9PEZI|nr:hypothetical protein CCUS01_13299 [Colletotrichum cuscutae]
MLTALTQRIRLIVVGLGGKKNYAHRNDRGRQCRTPEGNNAVFQYIRSTNTELDSVIMADKILHQQPIDQSDTQSFNQQISQPAIAIMQFSTITQLILLATAPLAMASVAAERTSSNSQRTYPFKSIKQIIKQSNIITRKKENPGPGQSKINIPDHTPQKFVIRNINTHGGIRTLNSSLTTITGCAGALVSRTANRQPKFLSFTKATSRPELLTVWVCIAPDCLYILIDYIRTEITAKATSELSIIFPRTMIFPTTRCWKTNAECLGSRLECLITTSNNCNWEVSLFATYS